MASSVPVPRSYQQILADQVLAFKARFGIRQLKVGSSILTALEAAAQSDLRSTQDIFNALDLRDTSRLTGQALEFEARSEGLTKNPALPAAGRITISDSTMVRVSTSVYSGASAPVAGTSTLRVVSALDFPATGQIYLGRGTVNVEGPISYSAKTQFSGFWTLTLSTPTATFHNVNEDVVLAQKGDRVVPSGTVVTTARDARTQPISYSTTADAEILDGEVSTFDVPVTAQEAGTKGNVPRGSITVFTGLPFTGATCTNPQPLTSGQDIESDEQLVQRLILVKSSKSRGTSFAILSATSGVFSPEQNRRVVSTTIVEPADEPATVYIDDGTGYEEINRGIPYEVLVDSASGGEQYFALSGQRPISRAFVQTTLSGPFSLVAGAKLTVAVGGVLSEHSFDADDFTSISSAQAVEIVSSINSDSAALFSARTAANGTKVSLFAKSETNDDIQVRVPSSGVDANDYLGFSTDTAYTLKLYKNDQLLYKDGQFATINSAAQSSWSTLSSGFAGVVVEVDGTPAATYSFTDADFVAANTGYTTVSKDNSIASWVKVFNEKIPGITASDGGGFLILTSNKGTDSGASIVLSSPVTSPNLISAGMFTPTSGLSAYGLNKDYTLNRNTAQIKLFEPLVAEDSLTVGSINTRGFVQSSAIDTGSITFPSVARLWICVDGDTEIVNHGTTAGTTYTITHTNGEFLFSPSLTTTPLLPFDWAVLWDTALSGHGAFRVMSATTSNFYLRYGINAAPQAGISLLSNGMVFARTQSAIQEIRLPAGVQTLDSLVTIINDQLVGATASVYRGKYLRISTNTYRGGDIMVVAADQSAQLIGFSLGELSQSSVPHLASLVAPTDEIAVPDFKNVGRILTENTNQTFPQFTTNLSGSAAVRPEAGRWFYGLSSYPNNFAGIGYPTHLTNRYKHISGRQNDLTSLTTRAPESSSVATQFTVVAGGLVRTGGTTVTVTTPSAHGFKAGDLIFVGPISTADPEFVAGIYPVASTPTTTSFTYVESGINIASVEDYGVNFWDDAAINSEGSDVFCLASPYAVGPYDSVSAVMNGDSLTQTYNIPMYRNVALTGTPGSDLDVTDTDNGAAALDDSFGTSEFFNDFWAYMKPRVVSHLGIANKEIMWRYNRFGSEGNGWSVGYAYPAAPNLPMASEITNGSDLLITLPSGTARTGLGLLSTTAFVLSSVASGSGRSATLTYYTPTTNITTITRVGTTVTAVLSSAHGLSVGQVVYVSGVTGVDFPSGPKIVVSTPLSTTFTYTEAGTAIASSGGIATHSPSAPTLLPIVVGDIITLNSPNTLWTLNGSFKVTSRTATTVTFFVPAASVTNFAAPTQLGDATAISVYPIGAASTADDVVTYVASDLSDLVSAELYGALGTGTIDTSTADEGFSATVNYGAASVTEFTMLDGVNYVRTSDLSVAPNTIRFKQGVDGTYTSAWSDEAARLVPVTSDDIGAWLGSTAVTGLGQVANIEGSGNAGSLQVTSENPGELGGVQFAANSLNGQTVPVMGGGDVSLAKVNFSRAFDYSLLGGSYVAVQNTEDTVSAVPNVLSGSTIALASNGTVTFSVATNTMTSFGQPRLIVHKVGDFAIYIARQGSAFNGEGDFIELNYAGASASNNGLFRIVRSGSVVAPSGNSFQYVWVENPNAVNEVYLGSGADYCRCYTANSLLPGDEFEIAYELGSESNVGVFEVTAITGNSGVFTVNTTFTTTGATVVGTNLSQLRMVKSPLRLVKFLSRIGIDPDSSIDPLELGISWAFFDTGVLLSGISETLGGNIEPLGRFNFATTPLIGANGYNVTTGLIGEVTRILYGDLSSPSVYPGVVAAGASVNVSGPNIKRIQVSLQLRLRTGATQQGTVDRVRNAVAAAVNSIPLGTAVDISRIVSAARAVSGVAAVSVLSPTYSSESDLIPVQANEKPFIFDPDVDVQITIAV